MRKILNNVGILLGTLVFFSIFLRDADCRPLDEILAKIDSAGSSIRTFQAAFVQKKEIALFASAMTSKGMLIVRPPDLLIWKVQEPLKAIFFINRGVAGTRDPNTGEVKRFPIASKDVDSSYGWFLRVFMGSLKELRQSFRIEGVDGDEGGALRLRLIPIEKKPTMGIEEILLGFDPNRFYLSEIVISESSGDRTEISLKNIKVNRDIHKEIPSWLKEGGKR